MYGRSPCGERLRDYAPCGHWQTHTVDAGLPLEGLTATAVFNGSTENASFVAYVDQVLRPTLRAGMSTTSATAGIESLQSFEKRSTTPRPA